MTEERRGKDKPVASRKEAQNLVNQLELLEQEILAFLANGESSRSIAAMLALDVAEVTRHRATLMKKLRADVTADAVRIALLAGMDDWQGHTTPH